MLVSIEAPCSMTFLEWESCVWGGALGVVLHGSYGKYLG